MKLKDLERIFHIELDAIYGKEEVSSFFFMLIESLYDISRLQLALDVNIVITKEEQEPVFNALDALKNEKPIQYILGETEFFGLPFKVNENTLIPRPETEELVEWIINDEKQKEGDKKELKILDIGTGSGCIAISLAKNLPNAKVYALDVSKEAIKMAKKNAELNGVEVAFLEKDILEELNAELDSDLNFDIIVSNPPYVRNLEKLEMKPNVLKNEPHLALFVDDDNALQFYKAITEFAVSNLRGKGSLYFEINEYLGKEMVALLKTYKFDDIELKHDLFGKDRMLKGVKN